MNEKEILVELIGHLYDFDCRNRDKRDYDIRDFLGYLFASYGAPDMKMREISGDRKVDLVSDSRSSLNDISILLVLMYRYARLYIKKALKRSAIRTPDEFSFLITLMTYESLTKTELIRTQVMEKTSGTEVIKRLLRNGFIKECADPEDKRSVRVSISEKGRKEILDLLPDMRVVSGIVVGDLNESEISTLGYLLKRLDHFHNDIFMNRRQAPLAELSALRPEGKTRGRPPAVEPVRNQTPHPG